jgi:hypothetical protein
VEERGALMLLHVCLAGFLIVVTTGIHAGGMMLALYFSRFQGGEKLRGFRVLRVSGVVLLMFNVSLLEVLVWAVAYLKLNAIEGVEKAVYFSMVTFTTLGYGDVLLDEHWRLLASFEAANGILMFGWSTAIVIAVVQRLYVAEKGKEQGAGS